MTLNVLGQRVRIVSRKNLRRDENADGMYSIDKSLIELDSELSKDEKLRALIHELVHVVWLRIGLQSTKVSEDIEEILCEAIANSVSENLKKLNKV